MPTNLLRNIPSVSELLDTPTLRTLVDRVSHNAVVHGVRSVLDELRGEVQTAASTGTLPAVGELAERIARRVLQGDAPALRPVINATGILLHTGLGRAPLATAAVEAMVDVARDYASVELDLAGGQRSQRGAAVEGLLRELTGAEAAAVVNNCAGATLLTLAAVAAGREVIVSRGQLIEIGGSYRLPDVMSASGAVLREVGTTNKTRLADYRAACGPQTAALMLVHPSNFRVTGFSEEATLPELIALGRELSLPVIHDIGSGALVDFAAFGCPGEPLTADSIRAGADLVLLSGDKLLGGPQCGIILGRREQIERIVKHPLARALRVDKLTLAALAATLKLYRDPERAKQEVPLLQLLTTSVDNLRQRAQRLAPQMAAASAIASAEPAQDVTYLGGGSLPNQQVATWCIALRPAQGSVDRLAFALRSGETPVVGRVQQDRLLLDLRSVFPRQDVALVEAVQALAGEATRNEGKPPT